MQKSSHNASCQELALLELFAGRLHGGGVEDQFASFDEYQSARRDWIARHTTLHA